MLSMLWPMMLGGFALGLDAYVLAGLLPHIASDFQITQAQAGLGVALFTAAYAISAPGLSFIATKLSTKKALLFGLAIFSVGNALTALTTIFSIYLISRLIAGIGAGLYSPLSASSAADLVSANLRGRALSMVLAGLSIGTALGVPIGLQIEANFSWRWTMVFITVLGIISFLGIMCHKSSFPTPARIPWRSRIKTLYDPYILKTLSVTLLAGIASLGLYTYIAEVLSARDMDNQTTFFIWLWGVGGMVGALFVGKVIDQHLRSHQATLVLLSLLIFSYFLVSHAPVYLVGFSCLVWGLAGWSCMAPQQYDLVSRDPSQANISIAWNSSANYLGSAIGASLGAFMLSMSITPALLPIGAALVTACALVIHINKAKSS